jgi:hypothetical protein
MIKAQMRPFLDIVNHAVNAPLVDMSVYEPIEPSGKPRFIQSLCFELLDEAYRRGVNIPSYVMFRAETYASGRADYAETLAYIIVKIMDDKEVMH